MKETQEGRCLIGCAGYLAMAALIFGLIYSVFGIAGVIILLALFGLVGLITALINKAR